MQLRPLSHLFHRLNADSIVRFSLLSLLLFVLYCILYIKEKTTEVSPNKSLQEEQFSHAPKAEFKHYAPLRERNWKSSSCALLFSYSVWHGYITALQLPASVSDLPHASALMIYGWWHRLIKYRFKIVWVTLSNHLAYHFSFYNQLLCQYIHHLRTTSALDAVQPSYWPERLYFLFRLPMSIRVQTQHSLSVQI